MNTLRSILPLASILIHHDTLTVVPQLHRIAPLVNVEKHVALPSIFRSSYPTDPSQAPQQYSPWAPSTIPVYTSGLRRRRPLHGQSGSYESFLLGR